MPRLWAANCCSLPSSRWRLQEDGSELRTLYKGSLKLSTYLQGRTAMEMAPCTSWQSYDCAPVMHDCSGTAIASVLTAAHGPGLEPI